MVTLAHVAGLPVRDISVPTLPALEELFPKVDFSEVSAAISESTAQFIESLACEFGFYSGSELVAGRAAYRVSASQGKMPVEICLICW